MVCAIGGVPKCPKFGCSGHTFQGNWLLLFLMMDSTQKIAATTIFATKAKKVHDGTH